MVKINLMAKHYDACKNAYLISFKRKSVKKLKPEQFDCKNI